MNNFISRISNALSLKFSGRNEPDKDGFVSMRGYTSSIHRNESVPCAYACINLMAQTMTRLPKFAATLVDQQDDRWEPEYDHPATALMEKPFSQWDGYQFWEWFFRERYRCGNAYAYIMRDRQGRPVELIPAIESGTWVRDSSKTLVRNLRLWTPKTWTLGPPKMALERDVLALHGPGFDGVCSPSPVIYAANQILSTMGFVLEHNQNLLEKGLYIRQVIQTNDEFAKFTKKQRTELREELEETYAGAVNAGKVPILPPGYQIDSQSGMSHVDMQLIDLLKWGVSDTCRVWNIPPRMVHHYEQGVRVAKQSIETQAEDFVRWTVMPEALKASSQFRAKLLLSSDIERKMGIRLAADRIGAGSWTEQVNAVDTIVSKAGVLTANEGRSRLGYAPHPEGNKLYSPKGSPDQAPAAEALKAYIEELVLDAIDELGIETK